MYKRKYSDGKCDLNGMKQKNYINIRKHGIDFNDVVEMFQSPMLSAPDTGDYDETRWIGMWWCMQSVTRNVS